MQQQQRGTRFARAKTANENRKEIKKHVVKRDPPPHIFLHTNLMVEAVASVAQSSLSLSLFFHSPSLKDCAQRNTEAIHNFSLAVTRKELCAGFFGIHLPLRLKHSVQESRRTKPTGREITKLYGFLNSATPKIQKTTKEKMTTSSFM